MISARPVQPYEESKCPGRLLVLGVETRAGRGAGPADGGTDARAEATWKAHVSFLGLQTQLHRADGLGNRNVPSHRVGAGSWNSGCGQGRDRLRDLCVKKSVPWGLPWWSSS